ncbi:MAG: cell division FtsA domain-containing protein [Flavonifractor plautii]
MANAEQALSTDGPEEQRFFLVGYTPTQFWLDHYPLTTLLGHTGQHLEAAVVATFLPSEVVDSLYAVMQKAGLEVASMTLEPIAALNAAIPADLRLLNLALVDIGAGTSDIAVCRDGGVVGYTMATVAGDEITEALMRACLVDFPTAEAMKLELGRSKSVSFTDILGLEQTLPAEELFSLLDGPIQALADEIAQRICQVNGGPPSAVFLAGGGSKLPTLCARVAAALGIDSKRAALAGGYFQSSAYSDTFALSDPEYTTPLGIAVSAGLGLISDSYQVLAQREPRQALPQREPYGAGAADDEWVPLFRSHRPQRQKPAASDRREAQCVLWLPRHPRPTRHQRCGSRPFCTDSCRRPYSLYSCPARQRLCHDRRRALYQAAVQGRSA